MHYGGRSRSPGPAHSQQNDELEQGPKIPGNKFIICCLYGAPGEIRTPDLLVRSQLLYPAELRARVPSSYHRIVVARKRSPLSGKVPRNPG